MIAEVDARPVTPTERKIAEMLLENTGVAMMDSGGIYGRAWQVTRAKYGLDGGLPNSPFHGGPGHAPVEPVEDEIERVALAMRNEPPQSIDEYGSFSRNAFHFLVDALDYDPVLDRKWQVFQRVANWGKDRYDKEPGYALIPEFLDRLDGRGANISGIYGEGEPVSDNSYNYEHAVDRVFQFTLFTVTAHGSDPYDRELFLPEDSYVMLQIHGGADVRGGYTDPVLFRESSMAEYAILDYGRGWLRCENEHNWDSDNGGYTFNLDGMYGQGEKVMAFDDYQREKGALIAEWDEDRNVWLCPIPGCGAPLR